MGAERSRMGCSQTMGWLIGAVFVLLMLGQGHAKICTNAIADGVSHTLRAQRLAADPRDLSAYRYYRPSELISAVAVENEGGSSRRMMLMKQREEATSSSFLEAPSLQKVRLLPNSDYAIAQQTNLNYLLLLDVDRLVYSFQSTAGLNTSAAGPYGGWEAPDSELRGHFVGHYLSAAALMWASTGNSSLYLKMASLVDALEECQDTGYLSAFPSTFFDRFEALEPVWAPYYTIHKIMAGLLDQYTLADNKKAFRMVVNMTEYFYGRVQALIETHTIERHWQSLNEETGGMNDVLYRIFRLTNNPRHLELAHLFDKPCFLGLLAVQADSLSGFHANTHIPIVVGAQMRYETLGDELYKDIASYFMKIVNSSHVYATGGTSSGEYWTDPERLGSTLGTENAESCTTYNMLKVARNLFRWTKEMAYVDYYERAVLNAILSTQRPNVPGVMLYMTPLAAGSSKTQTYHGWGTPNASFWCCYGTGVESFSKLGDSIYFQEAGSVTALYIVQFVPSSLEWEAARLKVYQNVHPLKSYDPRLLVKITFSSEDFGEGEEGRETYLHVRIPYWGHCDEAVLNGASLDRLPLAGTFLSIRRKWARGDVLSLALSAVIHTEMISDSRPEFASVNAIFFGPYLLAGVSEDSDWNIGPVDVTKPSEWVFPVPRTRAQSLFSFTQQGRVLSYSANTSLSMTRVPEKGTTQAMQSTFRIASPAVSSGIIRQAGSQAGLLYRVVSLELMSRPGSFIAHQGANQRVKVVDYVHRGRHQQEAATIAGGTQTSMTLQAVFQVLPALSGQAGAVSFEAAGLPGCYLSATQDDDQVAEVLLRCRDEYSQQQLASSSSFVVGEGMATYHPMSFVVHGSSRSFLLFPLNAFRDELYTVYFNMK